MKKRLTLLASAEKIANAEANLTFLCEPSTQKLIDALRSGSTLALHQLVHSQGTASRQLRADLNRLIDMKVVVQQASGYSFREAQFDRLVQYSRVLNEAVLAETGAQTY